MIPNKKEYSFFDLLVASSSLAHRQLFGLGVPPEDSMSRLIGQQKGWLDDEGNFTVAGLEKFRRFNAAEREQLARSNPGLLGATA